MSLIRRKMRLIHTTTYAIAEFFGDAIPRYAILSHTWEDGEVSYQDWLGAPSQKEIRARAGYHKIIQACQQAFAFNCDWIWVDTSCIDKTNNTELTEALNSMYHWYGSAGVCLAYLADVPTSPCQSNTAGGKSFRGSRWFTRGWTLQELIAPKEVVFFSGTWDFIGSRVTRSAEIQDATGIDPICFETAAPVNLAQFSVATRMSWASGRTTTRVEDAAYCLLGIFGVSMPLLYGEGDRAFLRLQDAVLGREPDLSILAWSDSGGYVLERKLYFPSLCLIFAQKPSAFASASGFTYDHTLDPNPEELKDPYGISYMTNLGLRLSIRLIETLCPSFVLGVFPTCHPAGDPSTAVWAPLFRSPKAGHRRPLWVRSRWPASTLLIRSSYLLAEDASKPHVLNEVFIEAHEVPSVPDTPAVNPAETANSLLSNPTISLGAGRASESHLPVVLVAFPTGAEPYTLAKTSNPSYRPQSDCAFPLTRGNGWSGYFARGYLIFKSPGKDDICLFFVVQLDEKTLAPLRWTCRVCCAMSTMPTLDTFTSAGEQWRNSDRSNACFVVMSDTLYSGVQGPRDSTSPHYTLFANAYFMPDEDDGGLSDSWVQVERPLSSPA